MDSLISGLAEVERKAKQRFDEMYQREMKDWYISELDSEGNSVNQEKSVANTPSEIVNAGSGRSGKSREDAELCNYDVSPFIRDTHAEQDKSVM